MSHRIAPFRGRRVLPTKSLLLGQGSGLALTPFMDRDRTGADGMCSAMLLAQVEDGPCCTEPAAHGFVADHTIPEVLGVKA
jgi:hypothetical protein